MRSVAAARGGRLVVDEAPEGGAFVHIVVPAADGRAPVPATVALAASPVPVS